MAHYFYTTRSVAGIRFMGGMSGLIFRTALRRTGAQEAKSELNLVSSDVLMIAESIFWGPRVVGFSVMILCSIAMLVHTMGPSAIFGVGLMAALMAAQGYLGGKQGIAARNKQEFTDDRVKITRQAIVGMKVLKQNVWENQYIDKVKTSRESELGHLLTFRLLFAANEFLSGFTSVMVSFIVVLAYVSFDNDLKASTLFMALAIFNSLRQPLTFIPIIADAVVKGFVSLNRLEEYLKQEPVSVPEIQQHLNDIERGKEANVMTKETSSVEGDNMIDPDGVMLSKLGKDDESSFMKNALPVGGGSLEGDFSYGDGEFSLKVKPIIDYFLLWKVMESSASKAPSSPSYQVPSRTLHHLP